MKKLFLLLSFIACSLAGYAQNTFGGIGLRVNDTTTYQTNAAGAHSAGYRDLYFNNQATNKHWDWWNGSSYDHIYTWGGWPLSGNASLYGDVTIHGAGTRNLSLGSSGSRLNQFNVFTDDYFNLESSSGGFLTTGGQLEISSTGLLTFQSSDGLFISTDEVFFPSASVLAFANPDVLITHSSNALTVSGGEFNVVNEDYNPTNWDGDNGAPTKNSVRDKIESLAPLASPTLTGDPTAPTPTAGDDDTSIATTAFVQDKINENNVETVVASGDITLALTDIYKKVQVTKNTAQTITIPTDGGGTDWVPGMWFYAEWYGGASGQTTFVPSGGVTIHSSSNTLVIPGQYSVVYIEYIGSDVWNLQNGSPATSWTAYSPTVVGFSGSPTFNFRYLYVPSEKRVTISFQMPSATSNATTFTITTPITSAATYQQTTAAQVQNNGTFTIGAVSIPSSSTTITVSRPDGSAWTATGNKAANFTFTYETQ